MHAPDPHARGIEQRSDATAQLRQDGAVRGALARLASAPATIRPVTVGTRDTRSFGELTRAVLGSAMTMDEVFALLAGEPSVDAPFDPEADASGRTGELWVGSVGYERFRLNTDFAAHLKEAGVERLIDVRQLPISRRRGYAKTALGDALGEAGIEYVHMRALGNPKPTRELYKSGRTAEGRAGYEQYLLGEQRPALGELVGLLQEKRSALMCVEHDPATCHRTVIIEALRDELGVDVCVAELG
jgi:hypothetical protein